jgi:t-SNARE complex subunit (syntaxin)
MMRRFIFDKEIVGYTTIVVTNFPDFEDEGKCKKNEKLMKEENEEMAEIMNSCRMIIHVDNPPINIGENVRRREKKIASNRETREESEEILMTHLRNCQDVYKPKNLDKLNEEIQNYMTEKERLQQKLQQSERQLEIEKMKNEWSEEQKKELEELRKKLTELEEKIAVLMQGFFERMGKSIGKDID